MTLTNQLPKLPTRARKPQALRKDIDHRPAQALPNNLRRRRPRRKPPPTPTQRPMKVHPRHIQHLQPIVHLLALANDVAGLAQRRRGAEAGARGAAEQLAVDAQQAREAELRGVRLLHVGLGVVAGDVDHFAGQRFGHVGREHGVEGERVELAAEDRPDFGGGVEGD